MSEVKVNKISPRTNCGTVQLGDSGDTITIPAGATITNNGTQTGFGRTGAVDWDTTAKTASFTAVSGNGYFVNTTSGAITVTLPASPSAGDIVAVADYTRTFATNNVTLGRNGSPIGGISEDAVLSTNGQSVTFVYVDGTEGWINVIESTGNTGNVEYMSATGGTITTCGDYKIHTFTGPGTFTVSAISTVCSSRNDIDYLVVAGGGSGGGYSGTNQGCGGGGAGGFRYSAATFTSPSCAPGHPLRSPTAITATVQGYPITVGGGGAGSSLAPCSGGGVPGNSGSNSIFSTITSTGGGGGKAQNCSTSPSTDKTGGSGGGGSRGNTQVYSGGAGNTPPVAPSQGNPGGVGTPIPAQPAPAPPTNRKGGGGGGATAAGGAGTVPANGNGGAGAGIPTAFGSNGVPCGSFRYYAGGGGGAGGGAGSSGGIGGGGGGTSGSLGGNAGTTNTGGGGSAINNTGCAPASTTGAGGSGIVVIRYKFQ